MKAVFTLLFGLVVTLGIAQEYPYQQNQTYTHEAAIEEYKKLAKSHTNCTLINMGESDVGRPIHLFVISNESVVDVNRLHNKNKAVLLINNAIHPGEPCGVDASVKFANDLLKDDKVNQLLENTNVCIIPFYNVGGGLNRSCCSRAGQNGPMEYGFRGNAQNRDLNRDFIKCDSENAKIFAKIYHLTEPDVFIDAHATNGSDFQHTMTIIATQQDKLNHTMSDCMSKEMLPFLYQDMKGKKMDMAPYVFTVKGAPDNGIKDYLETPRYSTGYTTLFNTIGFVTETLKYKPYEERVEQTYEFFSTVLKWMNKNNVVLLKARKNAIDDTKSQTKFVLSWKEDTVSYKEIEFKGYEAEYVESEFGKDAKKLIYNHDKPFSKKIKYYDHFLPDVTIEKPIAYVVPQAYKEVVERLKLNGVVMKRIEEDTSLTAEMYYIKDYETVKHPYEGHYLHYNVEVEKKLSPVNYYEGDYIVFVNQETNRYIVETLEPQGTDSFFAWNFFDGILQQKEWFSPFSFESEAIRILEEDAKLKLEFEDKKKEDEKFATDRWAQLYYIYTHSNYYEPTHNRYPVARLIEW